MIPQVSWTEVCARRLQRNALSAPLPQADPAEAVAAMCAAHAQVMTAAQWSIGLRLTGATCTDVQNALGTERALVKTFGPRGTIHLLPARDLPLWTGALSAVPSGHGGFAPDVRLAPAQADAVIDAITDALLGPELTIDELTEAVIARTGSWAGDLVMPAFSGFWPRWRQVLPLAGIRGALCFGAGRGRNVTYTSPARWLPGFRPDDARSALPGLVRRYLDAYGPATPAHFAQWLAAPRRWAADLFTSLAGELQQVDLGGSPAWLRAGDTAMPQDSPSGLRLLPHFDAYAVAGQPRGLLFPGRAAYRALTPSGQAGNFPVILLDGTVQGLWHQRRAGRRLYITVEPFAPLTRARRRELDVQVQRIGEFWGAAPRLIIGAVAAGAHA